jgi:hypothetical protein
MATPTVDALPPGSRAAGFTITLGLAAARGKALRWSVLAAMDGDGTGLRSRAAPGNGRQRRIALQWR